MQHGRRGGNRVRSRVGGGSTGESRYADVVNCSRRVGAGRVVIFPEKNNLFGCASHILQNIIGMRPLTHTVLLRKQGSTTRIGFGGDRNVGIHQIDGQIIVNSV